MSTNTGRFEARARRDSKGMTLIEVLAALAIISVIAVGVSAALVSASGWNRLAADETRATAYAAEIMEMVKASPENLRHICPGAYSAELGNWSCLGLAVPGEREEMAARVTVTDYPGEWGLYMVDIEVSWETMGKPHKIELVGLVWGN